MAIHLQRDLDRIKKRLLGVGALVEQAIAQAIEALAHRRVDLADEVISGDARIDEQEVEVEEACLKMLALHQPVATDLRFVVAALKANNDLERMGDLAVNVARRARRVAEHPAMDLTDQVVEMARRVREMVSWSLDAFVRLDVDQARAVLAADDDVDEAHRRIFEAGQTLAESDGAWVRRIVHVLSSSRHLERIADLATNIAEDVLFMVEGEVVRHRELEEMPGA